MPLARYIAWVGTSLLALLFVANWFLPQALAEPTGDEINRPIIRIASVQQLPERIVIDTSLPTIVPPPIPVSPPTLVAEARPSEADPPSPRNAVERAKPKAKKKQVNQLAVARQPLVEPAPAIVSNSPAIINPPSTRLSFANIISGQLVRELFNLH